MEVLKKGSKGDSVVLLQKALNITADGDFGAKTEAAVKKFQAEHGLVADGVVGGKTWSALGKASGKAEGTAAKAVADFVIYDPLKVHITKAVRTVKYIAIHYTAGSSSKAGSARAVKKVFEKRKASADFAVDDRDIVQFNPDISRYCCWSVGDRKNTASGGGRLYGIATNRNTVSIEICSNLTKGYDASKANHEGWYFTDAAVENALKLVRVLMKRYNLPKSAVVRHYDVSGKLCPAIKGWNTYPITDKSGKKMENNEDAWNDFKDRL